MKTRLKFLPPPLLPLLLVGLPSLVSGQCFGGTLTMEKTVGVTFNEPSTPLFNNLDAAITSDCNGFCKDSPQCQGFSVEYEKSTCVAYDRSSSGRRSSLVAKPGFNYFEKICLTGGSPQLDYNQLCGQERLWSFERVLDSFLEGHDNKTFPNVDKRADCLKLCLAETEFVCRSCEYDITQKVCRLSREDRRTKPADFVSSPGSFVDYMENQCVMPLPDCRYVVQNEVMVVSMDALEFANIQSDCESLCDTTRIMNCRAYTFDPQEKRCYLSGDDSVSLNQTVLPLKAGVLTGEKQCTVSQCEQDQGTIIYEKITGQTVRTARESAYQLDTSPGGLSEKCASRCREDSGECPAFAVDYVLGRCFQLDRNTQGRNTDIISTPGKSYFEKICVRAKLPPQCIDRVWHFERAPGMELRGLDDRQQTLVQSRRDCIEACLQETSFLCRSAEYDSVQLVCRISRSDRRTNPDSYVEAASPSTEYLENQCIPVDDRCPYRKTEGAYPVYLDDTIGSVLSEQQCQRSCTNYRKFNCRSLSFYPAGSQCFISGDDKVSGGGTAALQNRPGTTYFERDCRGGSGGGGGGGGDGGGSIGGGSGSGKDDGTTGGTDGTTLNLLPPIRPTTFRPRPRPRPGGGGFSFAVDRCRLGSLTYEKVTGYELTGVKSNILNSSLVPGITQNCADACKNADGCMAFNLDYNRFECYALDTGSSEKPQNLRQSSGAAYFEAVCLRRGGCGLLWTYERIPNFELVGRDRETLNGISKSECMERCLEERRFVCRSVSYEYSNRVCRLSIHNRFSARNSFQAAPNVDYMENQCAPKPRDCVYGNNQRDRYLIYTTKSTSAFTDATCRRACDLEEDFNCRSYSFLSMSNTQTNQCYLSGDTGTDAGNNAFQFMRGAMFAEKQCRDFSTDSGGGSVGGGGGGVGAGGDPEDEEDTKSPSLVNECRFTPTYDKVLGVDLRGQREEIRTRDQLGITIECLKECDRRRDRCLAVTLDTSPSTAQRCYALQRGTDNDPNKLTTAPTVSFFEKTCIPERSCGKAWAFVRVPGYDLEVNGLVLNNVPTRQECQAECLRATNIPCRSATYNIRLRTCRLMAETRRTDPESFNPATRDVEFLENQCAPDPPNCDYANYEGRFLPYFDRYFTNVFDTTECKKYCDTERDFTCRSFNFQSFRRECSLSSDDTFTVGGQGVLQVERDYFYSEKGACKTVKVDCTPTDMLVTFSFGTPFKGRLYATGNAQACFEMGNRQTQVILRVPLGSTCGTIEESDGKFVNTVVVQQHPLIMQESDRTVKVECSFEAGDQTVSFAPGSDDSRTGGGIDINAQFRPGGVTDIISNTAPTPTVRMRIYRANGQEANNVDLGELLTLRIEMEQSSAFAIFARNLEARTDNGELMTLIDNVGCPPYPNIFPELQLDERTKSLYGDFKAFRFPSTARVNFVATIRFCQDACEPVPCGGGVVSYGRRRRSVGNMTVEEEEEQEQDEQEMVVEVSTDGTSDSSFTFTLGSSPRSVDVPLKTTKRSVSSSSSTSTTTTTTTTTTGKSTSRSSSSSASTISTSPSPSSSTASTNSTSEKEPDVETPDDIPVALSLVVGEDTMPEGWDERGRHRYRDETYVADDYVCTPTSTVIAAVLTLLVLLCATVTGFVFFYRTKKRHWQKMGSCEPFPLPPQPKSQFFNSSDVMFRAAYGGFPGQSHLASNMAAFNTAHALAAMQEESPQYKE
ncbi:uncharacterized protein LOC123499645 isoform X7 [Portunus trituberculatus]|uniref:uncharacterized protein LOC123499645 isoform X7 n=1 Tax=Portunus trituberculatus TaxID=210409 RepID=UPI001E1CFD7D|nr:uncharacterized protein LOC123499645 isoform X7 [Portunus trituberculatus]